MLRAIYLLCLLGITHLATGQIELNVKHIKCFGAKDGSVTVTSVGGATLPIKSYAWSTGNSGQMIVSQQNLDKGTYSVTVTDANGCTATAQETVEAPDCPLRLDVTSSTGEFFTCGDASIIVTAIATCGSAPHDVNGSGPVYTREVRSSSFGNGPRALVFIVTDANGCTLRRVQGFAFSAISCARDPNDITGPVGVDSARWHAASERMPYLVRFENDPVLATSPAKRVSIQVPVPDHINPFTLRVGEFGWGPFNFAVPEDATFYQQRLDLTDSLNLFVDVTAGLDVVNNVFFWNLQSIDPVTLVEPIDPGIGFLPVNDTLTGSGEGFVNFSITPDAMVQTGDTVLAQAEIVFDINEPILTNVWSNVLDALPPTTQVLAFNDTTESLFYDLVFSGADDPGGVGLASYALYVSADSGDFVRYMDFIEGDTLTFAGQPGVHYQFYTRGIDFVGNEEALKSGSEASLFVQPTRAILLNAPIAQHACLYDSLVVDWDKVIVDSVMVEMTLDSAASWFTLTAATIDSQLLVYLDDTMVTSFAKVRLTDLTDTNVVATSPFFAIHDLPLVDAGLDTSICEGDFVFLHGTGANSFSWSPDTSLNNAMLTNPRATPTSTTNYQMQATDVFGCGGSDSVLITILDPCTWFGGPIVYVDSSAMGENNGTSWDDAFTDLQSALLLTYKYTDIEEIWVAEGTYSPTDGTDRTLSFELRDTATIYGGFEGVETMRSQRDPAIFPSRLSGDIGVPLDSTDNTHHIVRIDTSCTDCLLDGVTVEWAVANGISPDDRGAGVVSYGAAALKNVVIENNTSAQGGSGVLNIGAQAQLIVEDCIIRLNTSALHQDILNVQSATLTLRGSNQILDD